MANGTFVSIWDKGDPVAEWHEITEEHRTVFVPAVADRFFLIYYVLKASYIIYLKSFLIRFVPIMLNDDDEVVEVDPAFFASDSSVPKRPKNFNRKSINLLLLCCFLLIFSDVELNINSCR